MLDDDIFKTWLKPEMVERFERDVLDDDISKTNIFSLIKTTTSGNRKRSVTRRPQTFLERQQ